MAKTSYKLDTRDFGVISRGIDKNLTLRINKCGNVTLQDRKATKTVFVITKKADGYRITKRIGWDNPFGSTHKVLNGGKPFASAVEMMDYFKNFRALHRDWCIDGGM